MQCPNCSAQMGLEDAVCPYCGTPNAMAARHQADMERYRQDYQRTRADVMSKTSFMQSNGGMLVVLAVLLVAVVAGFILQANAWDIGYSIREGNVERNMAQSEQVMDAYLEQGDYGKFVGYFEANDLSMDYDSPYQALRSAAYAYVDLFQGISTLRESGSSEYGAQRVSSTCEYLADDLNRIYTIEEDYSYDLDRYLPDRMRPYLEDIRDRAATLAKAYLGLTDEEVAAIPDISEKRLAQMIEERVAS